MPGIQPRTPSRQLAAVLRDHITMGLYPPGHRLPRSKELCVCYGVTGDVMRNALAYLNEEGLIVSRVGDGHYVTIEAGCGRTEQDQLWSTMVAAILTSGLSTPEIARRVRTRRISVVDKIRRQERVSAWDVRRIINAISKDCAE